MLRYDCLKTVVFGGIGMILRFSRRIVVDFFAETSEHLLGDVVDSDISIEEKFSKNYPVSDTLGVQLMNYYINNFFIKLFLLNCCENCISI